MNDGEAESAASPGPVEDAGGGLGLGSGSGLGLGLADTAAHAAARRLDGRRKRIRMLNELLRELDMAVYMELLAVYYVDCSFFWLAVRALVHGSLLTPPADTPAVDRPPDTPKPFLPLLLGSFIVSLALHLWHAAPTAGEDTRGHLHGGLLLDFIGQQAPTSKWTLAALDLALLCLQLAMVAVHAKRRELKKALVTAHAGPVQDVDDEERGIQHRADSLSELGADDGEGGGGGDDGVGDGGGNGSSEEQDALLSSAPLSSSSPDTTYADTDADALDLLTSGQCIIGDFTLIDTLLHENKTYAAYRLTRAETGAGDMPDTLRRLNTLRARFGVGGG